jgi:branched-chain amino acid transport system permease protein
MAIGAYMAYKFSTGISVGPVSLLGLDLGTLSLPALPVLPSIILGGLASAMVGILFGLPSLRIKGLYLAVATLAAQFFFDWVFLRVKWFTNYAPSGSVTAPELNFFGYVVDSPVEKYLLALIIVTIVALGAKNLVRGNIGRQWMAIRDMDIAAELMGIRPLYAKLSAFAVSSFIVGIAGALWAFVYLGSWEPLAFSIDRSLQLLFMVIIGGLGSILGCFLGAAFILILPIALNQLLPVLAEPVRRLGSNLGQDWLLRLAQHIQSTETVTHFEFIIFGALICYLLIKEPHGFARLWSIAKEKLRLWPFPY